MKVQLQDQSVRLRLDEAELARLLAGESVENMTRFGGIEGWGMAVSLHGGERYGAARWWHLLPPGAAAPGG